MNTDKKSLVNKTEINHFTTSFIDFNPIISSWYLHPIVILFDDNISNNNITVCIGFVWAYLWSSWMIKSV